MSLGSTITEHIFVDTSRTGVLPKKLTINAASSGNNTLIALSAGKVHRIYQFMIVCSGAVTVTWESSGGTVLSGPTTYAANGGCAPPFCPLGHFDTLSGEGLILVLSSNVQVGGHLVYASGIF